MSGLRISTLVATRPFVLVVLGCGLALSEVGALSHSSPQLRGVTEFQVRTGISEHLPAEVRSRIPELVDQTTKWLVEEGFRVVPNGGRSLVILVGVEPTRETKSDRGIRDGGCSGRVATVEVRFMDEVRLKQARPKRLMISTWHTTVASLVSDAEMLEYFREEIDSAVRYFALEVRRVSGA